MQELVAGRYQILSELAKGGMGVVYRALDTSSGTEVALKCLLEEALRRPRLCAMFEREYHTLARLSHPRIVQVFDFGTDQGRPYYTMELLDGRDLGELAPIPYKKACSYLRDVASSLALLHTRNRLHRDLSPRNVRLTSDDRCKLLDFGTMADFGVQDAVVGTPPMVPPEALRGTALDQRTDVYALGALAYRLLTKRHAYHAMQLEDLPEHWRKPPPRLQQLVPGIPPALDELVMSMLNLDPVFRPASASVVIDRLTSIAELPPDADRVQTVESYLLRAKLVGRARPLETLQRRIARAHVGSGSTVLIEGNPGVGKTRLLDEAALHAQLSGALAIRVEARHDSAPNAVANAIARALLHAAPQSAKAAAVPYATVLSRVFDELSDPTLAQEPNGDTSTLRSRLHSAFLAWLLDLSAQRTLVLLIDDLHHVDEASAAILCALTQSIERRRVMIIATRRLAGTVAAEDAVAAIATDARRLRIHRLRRQETHELMVSMFGDVPNVEELSDWLHDITTGSPKQSMELVRHLRDTNVIRFADGLWVLPPEVLSEELPASLIATMSARARALSTTERALAETLCVRRRAITLPLCLALTQDQAPADVLRTLDDLVGNGVLVGEFDGYQFAQEALRECLLQELSEGRSRSLHKRVGDALLQLHGHEPEEAVEAGWHLLRGGDERRGADLLAQTAPKLASRGVATFSALPALEAALNLYERQQQRSPEECLRLRTIIVASMDREAVNKYSDETLEALHGYAGGSISTRMRPWVGGRLATSLGLTVAAIRRFFTPAARRGPLPYVALVSFYRCAYAALYVRSSTMDVPGMERLSEQADTFADAHVLGKLASLVFRAAVWTLRGNPSAAHKYLLDAAELARAAGDRWNSNAAARRGVLSTIYIPLGMMYAQSCVYGERTQQIIDELARLGSDSKAIGPGGEISNEGGITTPEISMAAHQIRMIYHMVRGERALADARIGKLRAVTVQTGLSMQFDIWRTLIDINLSAVTRDIAALRRGHEMLLLYVESFPQLAPYVEMAEGFLSVCLKSPEEAHGQLARCLPKFAPGKLAGWDTLRLLYATSLIEAREPEKARDVLRESIENDAMNQGEMTSARALLTATLARAEAELGEFESATARIIRLTEELKDADQPTTVGYVHEQGAFVANLAADPARCKAQLEIMKSWYGKTRNASMLMRVQSMYELLAEETEPNAAAMWGSEVTSARQTGGQGIRKRKHQGVQALFEGCKSLEERAARALHLIVEQTGGLSGHLYLLRDGKLRQLSTLGEARDDELERMVQEQLEAAASALEPNTVVEETPDTKPLIVPVEGAAAYEARYATLLLAAGKRDKKPIGAVSVRIDGGTLRPMAAGLLEAITEQLRAEA